MALEVDVDPNAAVIAGSPLFDTVECRHGDLVRDGGGCEHEVQLPRLAARGSAAGAESGDVPARWRQLTGPRVGLAARRVDLRADERETESLGAVEDSAVAGSPVGVTVLSIAVEDVPVENARFVWPRSAACARGRTGPDLPRSGAG